MRERMLRGFALAGLWIFFAVSWLAYSPTLWPAPVGWRSLSTTAHPCGPLGLALAHVSVVLLGRVFSIVLVAALGVLTLATWLKWSRSRQLGMHARLLGIGALGAAVVDLAAAPGTGGVLGRVEIRVLLALMGKAGTTIVVAALVAIVLVRYGGPVFRLLMAHSCPLRQRAGTRRANAGNGLVARDTRAASLVAPGSARNRAGHSSPLLASARWQRCLRFPGGENASSRAAPHRARPRRRSVICSARRRRVSSKCRACFPKASAKSGRASRPRTTPVRHLRSCRISNRRPRPPTTANTWRCRARWKKSSPISALAGESPKCNRDRSSRPTNSSPLPASRSAR